MMKALLASIFVLFFISSVALAQEGKPVWFTGVPNADGTIATPKSGDDILIYARLNNTTKDPIIYTVNFTTVAEPVGSKTVTIPGYTQQSVSIEWMMPDAPFIVTAKVTKATDKNKKEIISLKDTLIGTVALSNKSELPKLDGVKGFFNKTITKIEVWRVKQHEYFTNLKKLSQGVLGTTTLKDVSEVFKPDATTLGEESVVPIIQNPNGKTVEYAKLVYATMGEYYFGHKTLFYISLVLLGLFVLRFIFRRFF